MTTLLIEKRNRSQRKGREGRHALGEALNVTIVSGEFLKLSETIRMDSKGVCPC
jgi:hypothetical protein